MAEKISIVFDCGATNVKAVAVDENGNVIASKSFPNNTQADPEYQEYRIWDVDEIWEKMCMASREICNEINTENIIGLTVTTFGVDGVLFSKSGDMLHPMISWQCERTVPIMADIDKYMPLKDIYNEAALLPFNFNTINKMIWYRENRPDLLDKAYRFLFAPSVFIYFMTGVMKNDITMAGTSMMTAKRNRDFSPSIMEAIGVSSELFGPLAEPGDIIGNLSQKASDETGLPSGIPVVASGHDTQFAVYGSSAGENQPVLSSGTWEILMVRSLSFLSGAEQLENSITTELDPIRGYFNIGNQWIASGMLEWASRNMYADILEKKHEYMIAGAAQVNPGSNGIRITPKFYEESDGKAGGQILGLKMESTRDEVYRAMLESLGLRLKEGLLALEAAGSFKAESILCVGGGSKNNLWNQIRADITGLPITVIDKKETTVLGAAMFVMYAAGLGASPDEVRNMIPLSSETFSPGPNKEVYRSLF